MAWVFSNWPGYFDFGLGIFRGLGTIGPSDMQWFDLACRPHRWWHHWKSVKVPVPVLPHKWCNQIVDMVHCKGFEKGAPTAYGWNALPLLNSFFRQIDRFCTLLESYDMRSMESIFGPKLKEKVTNSPCVWLRNVVAQIFLFFKILCNTIILENPSNLTTFVVHVKQGGLNTSIS